MTRKQVEAALIAAHKAGNKAHAAILADWLINNPAVVEDNTPSALQDTNIEEKDHSVVDYAVDIGKGLYHGTVDAISNVAELGRTLGHWAGKDYSEIEPIIRLSEVDAQIGETETGVGDVAHFVGEWLLPGIGIAGKGSKGASAYLKTVGKVGANTATHIATPVFKNAMVNYVAKFLTQGKIYTPGNVIKGIANDLKQGLSKAVAGTARAAIGRPTGVMQVAGAKIDMIIRMPARTLASIIINSTKRSAKVSGPAGSKVAVKELDKVTKEVTKMQKELSELSMYRRHFNAGGLILGNQNPSGNIILGGA